jgi:uncharacterized membrane protein YoaK (UPF0700 family)
VEGRWLWAALVVGAGAGTLAFVFFDNWTGFSLCAAATVVALTQLVRILLRKKAKPGDGGGRGGGKRRW